MSYTDSTLEMWVSPRAHHNTHKENNNAIEQQHLEATGDIYQSRLPTGDHLLPDKDVKATTSSIKLIWNSLMAAKTCMNQL